MTWNRRAWEALVEREATRVKRDMPASEREELERLLRLHDLSLETAWRATNDRRGRAAASTLEALAYQLRAGPSALRDPKAQDRLAQLDEGQMRELCGRLTKERWGISKNGEKPPRVPPWKPGEIESLVQKWSGLHG